MAKIDLVKTKGRQRYPFASMEIGDYFDVKKERAKGLRNSAYHHARKYGPRFSTTDFGAFVRCMRVI